MKITVWLLTRERETWITAAEAIGVLLVVLAVPGFLARLVGVVLLTHVSYKALTSLPMGQVPRRPEGSKAVRRNQDLRSRVVRFLTEMRRAEDYVHQAEVGRRPSSEVEKDLEWARKRMMAAAAEVVRATGRVSKVDRASLGEAEDAPSGPASAPQAIPFWGAAAPRSHVRPGRGSATP